MFITLFVSMFAFAICLTVVFELVGRKFYIPSLTMAHYGTGCTGLESAGGESRGKENLEELKERIKVLEAIVTDPANKYYD